MVTTDGLPLAYEVMKGNTSDRTTLPGFLKKIEDTYAKRMRAKHCCAQSILRDLPQRATPPRATLG